MAQFYATIRGNRGEATRIGSKDSGITGHIRGWHVGAKVTVDHENGKDIVRVYKTDGSRGFGKRIQNELIAEFIERKL